MKREFPEIPFVGVGAIIIEDARVVLVKRAHPPLQAEWSIPGGVLEVGELVRAAAVREAREETGLTVEPGELLGVYDRVLRNSDERVQYHYVLIDFLCRRVAGKASPNKSPLLTILQPAERASPTERCDRHSVARPNRRSRDRLRHDTAGPARGIIDAHE